LIDSIYIFRQFNVTSDDGITSRNLFNRFFFFVILNLVNPWFLNNNHTNKIAIRWNILTDSIRVFRMIMIISSRLWFRQNIYCESVNCFIWWLFYFYTRNVSDSMAGSWLQYEQKGTKCHFWFLRNVSTPKEVINLRNLFIIFWGRNIKK
jgi:hypothetical protein